MFFWDTVYTYGCRALTLSLFLHSLNIFYKLTLFSTYSVYKINLEIAKMNDAVETTKYDFTLSREDRPKHEV